MIAETNGLGKIKSLHGISAVYTQRLVIIAGLALIFFSAMLVAWAVRGWFLYALLALAFLIVEILTLVGWFMQRGAELAIYEKGFTYRDEICRWEDIEALYTTEENSFFGKRLKCQIRKNDGNTTEISDLIQGFQDVIKTIGRKMTNNITT